MTEIEIGLAGLGSLFLLIAMRVPIGVSLIAVSFGGIWALTSLQVSIAMIASTPYNFSASWSLSSVPMFLLMGYICYYAGMTTTLFNAARLWLAGIPGGLAVASVAGSAGFAAVSGSSVATAAAMGKISIPEMLRWRYDHSLATGTVAAAGTIGALIPPSIIMILFGVFAEVPVSKLFLGGVVVGLMTALSYVLVIVVRVKLNPALAPDLPKRSSWSERMEVLPSMWPILLIIICVFGGMFSGYFTATEAGGIGALLSVLLAAILRKLTWKAITLSLYETVVTTSALFVIAIGASLLTRFLALSGTGEFLGNFILLAGSDTFTLMLIITVIYLIIGMFIEPMGAMLLTLPVILPAVKANNLDLIWSGVLLVKYLEVGMITPPVGMNVFVIKSVVGDTVELTNIFRGIAWFLAADLVVILILIIFPELIIYPSNLIN